MDIDIPYLIGIIVENSNETNENNKIPGQHGDVKCFATLNFGDYVDLIDPVYGGIKKAVLDYISENSLQEPEDLFSLTDSDKEALAGSREIAYNGGTPSEETGEYSSEKMFYSTVSELANDISKFIKLLRKPELEPSDTESGTFGSVLDINAEKNTNLYPVKIGDTINVVWTDENGMDTNPIPMIVVMRKKFVDGVPVKDIYDENGNVIGEEPEETESEEIGSDEMNTDDEWGGRLGTDAELGEKENAEEDTESETDQEEDAEDAEDTENNEENENDVENGSEDEEQTVDDEWKSEETEVDGKRYDVFGNEIE